MSDNLFDVKALEDYWRRRQEETGLTVKELLAKDEKILWDSLEHIAALRRTSMCPLCFSPTIQEMSELWPEKKRTGWTCKQCNKTWTDSLNLSQ